MGYYIGWIEKSYSSLFVVSMLFVFGILSASVKEISS